MHRSRDVARERLLELFWPDSSPERARQSLKTATWSIRRALRSAFLDPNAFLDVGKLTLRWATPTVMDAVRFIELAHDDDPAKQLDALSLYRGDFLEGDYEEWTVAERERLASAYEELLGAMLKRSPDPRIAELLVARNPYEESSYAALIDAELRAGRSFAAAALVERCRTALAEVGSQPSPDFERRYARIAVSPQGLAELRLPFAAREATLGAIVRHFDRLSSGVGTVCLVHGEGGIGKSSVLDVASRLAVERGFGVVRARGIANDTRSFGPWAGLLESLSDIRFEDFARAGGANISMRLAHEIACRLLPHTVLFIDDGHVLRGEALDVLGKVSALASAAGHLVLIATRPEGLNPIRLALGNTDVEELPIGCLSLEELDRALRATIGPESRRLAEILFARTGGHPLFADGLLRSLTQGGTLERMNGRWRLARMPSERLAIPETIRRFIEVELRAAGEDACLAACALALDQDMTASDLIEALGIGETRVLDGIDELLARGLIVQPATGPEFSFGHDLIGEVAATLLNPGRRARIHAAFARLLENHGERNAALRQARHLAAAGDGKAAATAYADAATEALEWFAWRDAFERCQAGLRAVERHTGTTDGARAYARLKLLESRSAVAGGNDEAAIVPIRQAVEHARVSLDQGQLLEALLAGAQIELNCHELDSAIASAEEAKVLARARDDPAALSRALAIVSSAHCHFGRERESLEAAQEALDAAQHAGRADVITAAADTLLRRQITWWKYADALATAELGLQAARRAGWVLEGAFRFTRGALCYYLERYEEAERELLSALAIAEDETGERRWLITSAGIDRLKLRFFIRYMLGVVYAARSEWDRAIEVAAVLTDAPLSSTSFMIRNNVLNLRIDALLGRRDQGDVDEAARLAAQLHEDRFAQGSVLDLSACVELTQARVAAARRSPNANESWLRACAVVERNASATPLEADRAFDQLARAADDLGDPRLREVALGLQEETRARRLAAAGRAWSSQAGTARVAVP